MKILIVGGAGYIGGYLTDVLGGSHDVTVYDNIMYETRYVKPVKFIHGDIRDINKLSTILSGYDTVIWLAAIVGDGACAISPTLTKSINYATVKWLTDNYTGKIIFMSTCSVYGINHDLIDELATPNPLSVYAETKLDAETYLTANHDNYLVFRLGTLFGLGDSYSRIRLDLVTNILTLKAVNKQPLSVFGGEQWRPLLHVKDVAHAIDYCLDNEITGLYNLSNDNYTIAGIAKQIQEIIPDTKVDYTDISFEDMRNYKVSSDKIKKLGWNPIYDLSYGIKEIKALIEEKRIVNPNDIVYSNAAYVKRYVSEYNTNEYNQI